MEKLSNVLHLHPLFINEKLSDMPMTWSCIIHANCVPIQDGHL